MQKINDRVMLGIVAGLGGNLAKLAIGQVSKELRIAEIGGPERAAGMLIPAHKLAEPTGKAVGIIADQVISGILGVATVYGLSISGTDKAVIKGAASGQAMWSALYGVLSTFGATTVKAVSPRTVLSELVGHTAFGVIGALLATTLGDPSLFNGKTPVSASPVGQPQQQMPSNVSYKLKSRAQQVK